MTLKTQRSGTIHVDSAEPVTRVAVQAPKPVSRKAVFVIFFVTFLVNAVIVLVGLPERKSPLALNYSMGFGDLYDLIAKNLDEGNGYRVDPALGATMLREPGYPLVLAAAFKLGGYGIRPARVACVLLAFGVALILLRLARKITGDAMTALTAAVLFLLYPGILVAEARAGVEMLAIFTVMLFMLVLYRAVEKRCLWRYWAAGLLLGVSVLVRSGVLLFPLLLLVYFLLVARGWLERGKAVERIAVLALGAVLVMSPWIIRNYALVHEFVPTASIPGVSSQEGLYTCESAAPGEPFVLSQTRAGFERAKLATQLGKPFVGPYYQLFYTPHDEIAFNRALLSHVSTEYRNHPELLARCAAKNVLFNFWFLGKRPESTMLNVVVQAPLLGLALGGVSILRKRRLLRKAGTILLYILYVPTVHAPIIAHARHSMLVVPFLATLAAISLVSAWRSLSMSIPLRDDRLSINLQAKPR